MQFAKFLLGNGLQEDCLATKTSFLLHRGCQRCSAPLRTTYNLGSREILCAIRFNLQQAPTGLSLQEIVAGIEFGGEVVMCALDLIREGLYGEARGRRGVAGLG